MITIIFTVGLFYYAKHNKGSDQQIAAVRDIKPGKMGATLTLANGKKIRLADAINGEIAKEAGIIVSKTANGELVYEIKPSIGTNGSENLTNTLATARGETYVLTLPDKSKVWLNAASSLTYTANLLDKGIRKVKLQGEAYFEISRDKAHPFVVSTAGQDVEILGTRFNINSYVDEPSTTTTLLEGSVKVSKGAFNHILKPNQQSLLSAGKFRIENVSAEDAVAWKDGLFIFNDEPLENIMRRIERWYDVKVDFDTSVDRTKRYGGSVSRYDNVSSVFEVLESTKNIHFKIEGRSVLVMK